MAYESVLDQLAAHLDEKPVLDAALALKELHAQDAVIKRLRKINAGMLDAALKISLQFHAERCEIAIYGQRGPKGEKATCRCHVGMAKAAIAIAETPE